MSEFVLERIRENLTALKMKNTLQILDNYLERAVKDNLNIVDVLDHILIEEAVSRRKRAYEQQLQTSGFPMKKSLDDFDFGFQPSIDKRQIDELCTMRFLENAENIVFLGPPGVGKTHLATALGMETAKHRFSTYYSQTTSKASVQSAVKRGKVRQNFAKFLLEPRPLFLDRIKVWGIGWQIENPAPFACGKNLFSMECGIV